MCENQVSFNLSYAITLNVKIKEGPISNNIIIHWVTEISVWSSLMKLKP